MHEDQLAVNSRKYLHSIRISQQASQMDNTSNFRGKLNIYDMPVHTDDPVDYQHPEVQDITRNINDIGKIDFVLKHEPFFPQPNSPVECFKAENSYPNVHAHRSSPRKLLEDQVPVAFTFENANSDTGIGNNDTFSLHLKLELENYVHACEIGSADQFRKFRNPVSPASSHSCSTSSLLSIAPTNVAGFPSRRHSFSATVQNPDSNVNFPQFGSATAQTAASTSSNSANFRQRSHTFSSCSSKSQAHSVNKQHTGWHSSISSQSDLDYRIGGLRIRQNEHKDELENSEIEECERNEWSNKDAIRKESIEGSGSFDPLNNLFVGPFGKKRKMVHERKQSMEGTDSHLMFTDDHSPHDINVLSPVGSDFETHKEKVDDIVEEDEFDDDVKTEMNYEESNEPLNLCVAEEPATSAQLGQLTSHLTVGTTPNPHTDSVLRRQLLGLTETIGPTPPQYQTRDRSASMSVITLRNRSSVIQETRAALNPRKTLSPPPNSNSNGMPSGPSHATSNISINSSTTSEVSATKKTLQCQDCGKVFSQLRNYRYHRSRHEGTSQFACTCPVCHKQFNDRGYLSSHLKIHKNAKEYQCEFCEKSFNQRVAYNMHIRIHTGVKPHQCVKCDKAFSRRMLLKQHERTHTGERPYKCEVCGKAFADRSNMLLHQRLHTGLRPFHCDICGKSFSKNHHLKTHLNHHAGIKPYQCSKCNATFSQSSNMKTHFRKCTTVPMDESTVTGINDYKVIPSNIMLENTNSADRNYHPPTLYNFQLPVKSKLVLQSNTCGIFSEGESERNSTATSDGVNFDGIGNYHLPQQFRCSSPSRGTHGTTLLLSSAGVGPSEIHGMQNRQARLPDKLYPTGVGQPIPSARYVPPSHSSTVDCKSGGNVPFLEYSKSPPQSNRCLQNLDKGSQLSTHYSSQQYLQESMFHLEQTPQHHIQQSLFQVEHTPQHHIQQSMQQLQLSPDSIHRRPGPAYAEGRARSNTWSTNGSGIGKRKFPL